MSTHADRVADPITDVVVLKLSGEAMGPLGSTWDGHEFESVGDQIAEIVSAGIRCGIVSGAEISSARDVLGRTRTRPPRCRRARDDRFSLERRALALQLNQICGMKTQSHCQG